MSLLVDIKGMRYSEFKGALDEQLPTISSYVKFHDGEKVTYFKVRLSTEESHVVIRNLSLYDFHNDDNNKNLGLVCEPEIKGHYLIKRLEAALRSKIEDHLTPINYARNGQCILFSALIEGKTQRNIGCMLRQTDHHCKTPLMHAAEKGHLQMIEMLVDLGAPLDARDENDWNALMYAIKYKHQACIDFLIDKAGGVSSVRLLQLNTTVLMFAARLGDEKLTNLFAKQEPIDIQDCAGKTALMYAAINGNINCIKVLLACGANAFIQDHNGADALGYAEDNGHKTCVMQLRACSKVTSTQLQNNQGKTDIKSTSPSFELIGKTAKSTVN